MTHAHDRQERMFTKHPGSKPSRPVPSFGIGNRIYQVHNPGNKGAVVGVDTQTGAFTVRYDEATTIGDREFTYPSYLTHNFALGNPPEVSVGA